MTQKPLVEMASGLAKGEAFGVGVRARARARYEIMDMRGRRVSESLKSGSTVERERTGRGEGQIEDGQGRTFLLIPWKETTQVMSW